MKELDQEALEKEDLGAESPEVNNVTSITTNYHERVRGETCGGGEMCLTMKRT